MLNRLRFPCVVFEVLEGKNVNLRVVEKEDLPLVAEWENNIGFIGEYNPQTAIQGRD